MKAEELGAWQALLQEELEKPYWRTLSERVDTAYAAAAVYLQPSGSHRRRRCGP